MTGNPPVMQRGLQKRDIQLMKVYSCQIQMLHVCSSPRPDADTCWFRCVLQRHDTDVVGACQ